MNDFLQICEVGLRDGLQNDPMVVPTEGKKRLMTGLVEAGLSYIESASYVRPSAVPQMGDSDEMMRWGREQWPDLLQTGLIFNQKGYDRALESGCRAVALALTVTESFCRANNRMSIPESLAIAKSVIEQAHRDGVWVRVYLSTAWVCPFEGPTPPDRTISLAETVWAMGIDELSVADTIGYADPVAVGRLMERLGKRLGMERLAVHLHDTQALGLANVMAAIQAGVRIVDASLGGLGGCPFAPGAAGNLATEDAVFLAYKLGLGTGVDFPALMGLLPLVEELVGHPVGGRIRAWYDNNQR
ncbi:MAG: hydroxymethylglutaryl-CoA lyase [Chloroflexi bacterium]|nr:hydroxymethylglutaryl-CoA lyase [Chloroflexota bacterium]MDA0246380.1 hydroxymethylglutaryl-CoA lyase [Chloroflexota bacterium]